MIFDAAALARAHRAHHRYLARRQAILHGSRAEFDRALDELEPRDDEHLAWLMMSYAFEARDIIRVSTERAFGPFVRPMFAVRPDESLAPAQLTAMQVITAASNGDVEMMRALVLPWVNGSHSHDEGRAVLDAILEWVLAHHAHVCDGGML